MKRLVLLGLILSLLFCFGCCKAVQDKNKVITVWHWMTDRDQAFQELARAYQAETGIKINFELYAPSDQYSQKVRAAAQGDNLPDIFGVLGEKHDFASFIKAGYIFELTPFMNADNGAWKNIFFSKALAVNEFNEANSYGVTPGIYGVPIDVMTIEMLYNKKLFKKAGLNPENPPKTWEEFIADVKRLKEVGIQGFVSGWGEIWMIDCFVSNYAFNIMGQEKVLSTIKGKVPYTDPDWIKVFDLFVQMRDNKALATGIITMINKTAEQLFANEKTAFAFNGSWCVNVYKGMNPSLEYGVMLPPQASEKFPMSVWGGAGSSFLVNAKSPKKQMAIDFLKWFTQKDQQVFLANKTNNLPANKDALSGIPEVSAQFADAMENSTHPSIWGVSEFPIVTETLDKGIQSIIIGEKTPQAVALEVQKIKERELARKK